MGNLCFFLKLQLLLCAFKEFYKSLACLLPRCRSLESHTSPNSLSDLAQTPYIQCRPNFLSLLAEYLFVTSKFPSQLDHNRFNLPDSCHFPLHRLNNIETLYRCNEVLKCLAFVLFVKFLRQHILLKVFKYLPLVLQKYFVLAIKILA